MSDTFLFAALQRNADCVTVLAVDDFSQAQVLGLRLVINPLADEQQQLLWPTQESVWIRRHWPSKLTFELQTKRCVLREAISLPHDGRGWCIVDGGAHLGDLAIPLAAALARHRSDFVVVAVEPDSEKAAFIRHVASKNGLARLVHVVHAGLSNQRGKCMRSQPAARNGAPEGRLNSGSVRWTESAHGETELTTLDWLMRTDRTLASRTLGVLHLDVEGNEAEVLQGAAGTLCSHWPVVVAESFGIGGQARLLLGLPQCYSFRCRVDHANHVFVATLDTTL